MRYLQSILMLSLFMFLAACGQQKGLNGKKTVSFTRAQLEASLLDQKFECATINGTSTCPSGIARLFIFNAREPENSSLCSGFLNGNNQLVTNNHCVATQAQCSETYISVYDGFNYQVAKCKSIIETNVDQGPIRLKAVDFTVMELDRAVRATPLPVSRFRPYIGETLTAWVVDHASLTDARITELSCQYQNLAKSMELKNCPSIQGNSGSPVVNSYGEIVGVLWGSTVDDDIDFSMPLEQRRNLDSTSFVTKLDYFKEFLLGQF